LKIKNILRFYLLLLIAYCKLSLAFGIGDIAVKSHLGESFAARIYVTDVEKSPDANCFSVTDIGDSPAFTKASVAIKSSAGSYQLMIGTHEAITEPVVNLHVTYHCDPVMHRDYVVLLDPPLANVAGTDTVNSVAADTPAGQHKPTAIIDAASNATVNPPSTNRAAVDKTIKRKKAAKLADIDEKLAAAYTGVPQTSAQPAADAAIEHINPANKKQTLPKDAHHLVISGGNIRSHDKSALPELTLRLETEIDLTREEQVPPLSNTDLMDEVTVMDNRLVHLEKQIISLQNTNTKLKADAQNATRKLEDSMQHLRLAAEFIALLAFIEWLRRKLARARLRKVEDQWFGDDHLTNVNDTAESIANNLDEENSSTTKSIFNDPFFETSNYEKSAGFGSADTNHANDGTTINSNASADILESADVFIEHGRPSLAIQLLQDYLIDYPAESPKIWLRLLSLLAANGPEAEYTQALADCSHYYRIKMPDFAEAKKPDHSSIEEFHIITEKLENAWKSGNAVELLNDFIYDRQSQPASGLGPRAFEELFLLKHIAEIIAANPDILNEEANKSTAVNAPAESKTPEQFDDTKAGFKEQKVIDGQTAEANETDHASLKTITPSYPFQDLPSYEVSTIANFDDIYPLDERFDGRPGNVLSQASSMQEPNESMTSPEALPTLQAAEIDFSPRMEEIAQAQAPESESGQNDTTPTAGNKPRPQRKTSKDSNLIDWDLTDDS